MADSISALIAEERGSETPDSELGPLRLARRLMLRGEALTNNDFLATYFPGRTKVTPVSQAATGLENIGFTIERTDVPRDHTAHPGRAEVRNRVMNLDYQPSDADYANYNSGKRSRPFSKQPPAKDLVEAGSELPRRPDSSATVGSIPLPGLDQHLRVYAIARDLDDGSITVGMANGERTWLMKLVGTAAR
jgi:hypothetical protein